MTAFAPAVLMAGLALAAAATAGEPSITTQDVEGSPIRVVRATADIGAPPRAVLAVIDDVPSYPSTFPYIAEARVLSRTPASVLAYQRLTFPIALLSDRDYVIRITRETLLAPPGPALHRRRWRLEPSAQAPVREGVVRVTVNEGAWSVMRKGEGSLVVYCIHTDPGGGVWKWIANQANEQAIPRLFDALRRAVRLPRYASAPDPGDPAPDAENPRGTSVCGSD